MNLLGTLWKRKNSASYYMVSEELKNISLTLQDGCSSDPFNVVVKDRVELEQHFDPCVMTRLQLDRNKEYLEKLAIKKRLASFYKKQSRKNGLVGMEKLLAYIPKERQFRHLRRGLVVAHLEFEKILELVERGERFCMVSGLNPSSQLHVGHKVLFDMLLDLQKIGGELYIPLTDDESYVDAKVEKLGDGTRNAKEKILPALLKMGFEKRRTKILVDTEQIGLYKFAIELSRYVSLAQVKALFGEESLANPGQVFYRGCVQLAQILLPQLPENGGPRQTLIPVGVDQHPYVLLARDVAKQIGMIPPCELVIRSLPSLNDPERKMSKSRPDGAIFLDDSEKDVRRKIRGGVTGALASLEEHKNYGGVPEACSVFALYRAYEPVDQKVLAVYRRYVKGEILMGELKKLTADVIVNDLRKFQVQYRHTEAT